MYPDPVLKQLLHFSALMEEITIAPNLALLVVFASAAGGLGGLLRETAPPPAAQQGFYLNQLRREIRSLGAT